LLGRSLDLEMQPINVLIGANGSGKSNFISVFRLLGFIELSSLLLVISLVQGRLGWTILL
jgi:predicted ATPase